MDSPALSAVRRSARKKRPVALFDEDSRDYPLIKTAPKKIHLTEHQKERYAAQREENRLFSHVEDSQQPPMWKTMPEMFDSSDSMSIMQLQQIRRKERLSRGAESSLGSSKSAPQPARPVNAIDEKENAKPPTDFSDLAASDSTKKSSMTKQSISPSLPTAQEEPAPHKGRRTKSRPSKTANTTPRALLNKAVAKINAEGSNPDAPGSAARASSMRQKVAPAAETTTPDVNSEPDVKRKGPGRPRTRLSARAEPTASSTTEERPAPVTSAPLSVSTLTPKKGRSAKKVTPNLSEPRAAPIAQNVKVPSTQAEVDGHAQQILQQTIENVQGNEPEDAPSNDRGTSAMKSKKPETPKRKRLRCSLRLNGVELSSEPSAQDSINPSRVRSPASKRTRATEPTEPTASMSTEQKTAPAALAPALTKIPRAKKEVSKKEAMRRVSERQRGAPSAQTAQSTMPIAKKAKPSSAEIAVDEEKAADSLQQLIDGVIDSEPENASRDDKRTPAGASMSSLPTTKSGTSRYRKGIVLTGVQKPHDSFTSSDEVCSESLPSALKSSRSSSPALWKTHETKLAERTESSKIGAKSGPAISAQALTRIPMSEKNDFTREVSMHAPASQPKPQLVDQEPELQNELVAQEPQKQPELFVKEPQPQLVSVVQEFQLQPELFVQEPQPQLVSLAHEPQPQTTPVIQEFQLQPEQFVQEPQPQLVSVVHEPQPPAPTVETAEATSGALTEIDENTAETLQQIIEQIVQTSSSRPEGTLPTSKETAAVTPESTSPAKPATPSILRKPTTPRSAERKSRHVSFQIDDDDDVLYSQLMTLDCFNPSRFSSTSIRRRALTSEPILDRFCSAPAHQIQQSQRAPRQTAPDNKRQIYPPLVACTDAISCISSSLVGKNNHFWQKCLFQELQKCGIKTVGDLAAATEDTVQHIVQLRNRHKTAREILQNYKLCKRSAPALRSHEAGSHPLRASSSETQDYSQDPASALAAAPCLDIISEEELLLLEPVQEITVETSEELVFSPPSVTPPASPTKEVGSPSAEELLPAQPEVAEVRETEATPSREEPSMLTTTGRELLQLELLLADLDCAGLSGPESKALLGGATSCLCALSNFIRRLHSNLDNTQN